MLLFRTPTRLRRLHFFNNMSGDGGGVAIGRICAQSPNMADFRMSSVRCAAEGGTALFGALASCRRLVRLDLADNSFGGVDPALLGAALAEQPLLDHLSLSDTGVEEDHVRAVCAALANPNAPKLATLDLRCYVVTAETAGKVGRLAARKRGLTALLLGENELGSAGAKKVAKALNRTAISKMTGTLAGRPKSGLPEMMKG